MLEGEVHETGGVQREFGSQKLKSQGGGADLRFDEMLGNSPLFDIVRSPRHPAGSLQFLVTLQEIFDVNFLYND